MADIAPQAPKTRTAPIPWTHENNVAFYHTCRGKGEHMALVASVRNPAVGHNQMGAVHDHYRNMFGWGDIWQGDYDGYTLEDERTPYSTAECLTIAQFGYLCDKYKKFEHRQWNYLAHAMRRTGGAVEHEWRRVITPGTYANVAKGKPALTDEEAEAINLLHVDVDPTGWMRECAFNAAQVVYEASLAQVAKPMIPRVHELYGIWNTEHTPVSPAGQKLTVSHLAGGQTSKPTAEVPSSIMMEPMDPALKTSQLHPVIHAVPTPPKEHTVRLGKRWSVSIRRQ